MTWQYHEIKLTRFTWFWTFVLATVIGLNASTALAEAVSVRAGVHPDYGRLVFDWPVAVQHSAKVRNRTLIIRFNKPIEPSFGRVTQVLRDYVTDIRTASDGRTIVAPLLEQFAARTSVAGTRVIVDLYSDKKAARISAKNKKRTAHPVRPIRLGPKANRRNANQKVVKSVSPLNLKNTLKVRAGYFKNYGRLIFDWPKKVGFTVDRKGRAVAIQFNAAAKFNIGELRRQLPSQISAAISRSNRRGLELSLVVAADSQLRYFHNGAAIVFDVVAPGTGRRPATKTVATAGSREIKKRRASERKSRKKKARPRALALVSVDAARRGTETAIRFNWRVPVAASVFQRAGSLWISFDRAARIDLGAIKVIGSALFRKVEQKIGEADVRVYLPFGADLHASVRREGTNWIVEAGPGRKRLRQELKLVVQRETGRGTELLVKTKEARRIMVVKDKSVGDGAYAIPIRSAGVGIRVNRKFPEFELLKSQQGLAIKPLSEDVRVRITPKGVVVFRKGGLTISPDFDKMVVKRTQDRTTRLLDFAGWRYGPVTAFQKIEHELLRYVTRPKGVQRNAARLGLARFYASHEMGSETLGVLSALLRSDPSLIKDPGIRALRGVANYFIRHYDEADADLAHPTFAGIRELYPWRAAIAAARGNWVGAEKLFSDTDTLITTLPSRMAVHFGLLSAEAALSVGKTSIAATRLGIIETLPATKGQLDQLAFLKGHLLHQRKKMDKAIQLWKAVAQRGDRPSRTKAEYAAVNAQLKFGSIKRPEAINRLERLKFGWRNSVFEYDLLQRLGELYALEHNLRDALVTLRQAATLYKDIKGARRITLQMRALFRQFYLEGKADRLEPIVALGLFNEFRELTPSGADGDLMIRKLANRLMAVDLLDDASALLDHQIKFRLKGKKRATVGARLASIRLSNNKPLDALAALDASSGEQLPNELGERRRLLRSESLMRAKRYDEALKVVENDFSARFDGVRAQIYWRAGRWFEAARTLALISSGFSSEKLQKPEVEILLRRSVALGLAGNTGGMDFLRERFGKAMEKSHRATAFKAVAGGAKQTITDFATLARRAAELDTFRDFLKSVSGKPATPSRQQTAAAN
ncbi:MAG: hypothetical protein GKS01_06095 [Alphaproteobacteria bacterium]|nr:hypothetical protein [Alphaproteobacteria bacterium]